MTQEQKDKNKEAQARYRAKNKERIKENQQKTKEQRRISQQKRRANNREVVNAYSKKYYDENKEKCKERARLYRIENIEKSRERDRKYREKNKERRNAASTEYYHANKDIIRQKKIRSHILDGDKTRLRDRARHAYRIAKKFGCKIGDLEKIKEFYFSFLSIAVECFYCNTKCGHGTTIPAEVDHRIPLCSRGDHDIPNLVVACKTCNTMKGGRSEEAFRQYISIVQKVREELSLTIYPK